MTNGNTGYYDPTLKVTYDPNQFSPGGFPPVDGGGGGGGAYSVDIGNGLIAVLDANGNVLDIRSAPKPPSVSTAAAYHPPTWKPGELGIMQQGAATMQQEAATSAATQAALERYQQGQLGLESRQLDQFDRQLDATIAQQKADLAEKRRQFDVTIGFEREKLAAEIRMLDKQLANNMAIAKMDANTRLSIAGMEGQVALRGQDISREQFAGEMGARRAEFAVSALRDDPVAQGMFMLGETGGTTPLEVAAGQFPVMAAPPVRDVNTALPGYQGGGTIPVGGTGVVGETQPEIVRDIPGGGTQVIPIGPRETMRRLIAGTFDFEKEMPRFGGLPAMEPVFGAEIEAPGKMAYRYSQLPFPLQQVARSTWGVRGMPAQEALRRMGAATPVVMRAGTMARAR